MEAAVLTRKRILSLVTLTTIFMTAALTAVLSSSAFTDGSAGAVGVGHQRRPAAAPGPSGWGGLLGFGLGFHAMPGLGSFPVAPGLSGSESGHGVGASLVGSTPVGQIPGVAVENPATDTIYVANGYNPNGPIYGGDTVSVIDTRHCNAGDISKCRGPWPTITVGDQPSGIAIDQATDTVYVSNYADNTVSVFNGATCDAMNHAGCAQTPATVPVGIGPVQIAADAANHTVYVATFGTNGTGNTDLSMIDSATCNATNLAGCPHSAPPTVNVGAAPQSIEIDRGSHTVYVSTFGLLNGWTVFDTNTCNANDQAGCSELGYITGDPSGPFSAQVDTANDTLYTANYDNTVSAYPLADCNARDLAGCASLPSGTVTPFPLTSFEHSLWVAVDQQNHSVYVAYQKDDALLVIDANACNGTHPGGCSTLAPPEIHTGSDPESVLLDSETQTLYTANTVGSDVSVINASACSAVTTIGCRHPVASIALAAAAGLATDPAVNTTYVTNGTDSVSMIDTSRCNAYDQAGCAGTLPAVSVGAYPDAVAVNPATHTVYVADAGAGSTGTITAFNDLTCNAEVQSGCAKLGTLQVPNGNPVGVAINPLNDTLYVATLTSDDGPNLISVFNGATCNALTTTGCGQSPANAPTGFDGDGAGTSEAVAVNPVTNTIYATNVDESGDTPEHSVYEIDGPTCDAANTTGCGNTPDTISVGTDPVYGDANPNGVVVDSATDTIYVADIYNGEGPGKVSVINGAICDSLNHSGCGQTPSVAPAGFGAVELALDPTTNQVYTTNIEDTSVTTIDGSSCDGTHPGGCAHAVTQPAVGDYPSNIAVDPAVATAYVQTIEGVSLLPLDR
jgi:DNA-binding beta-propeller fold protein YncE